MPLVFDNLKDYDNIDELDELLVLNAHKAVEEGKVIVKNKTKNVEYVMNIQLLKTKENDIKGWTY